MAESSPEATTRRLRSQRWGHRAAAAVATIAMLTAFSPAGPPPQPVVPPERARLAGVRVLASVAARIPTRLRRWIRLFLAPRAIAEAPTCRTDHPVLPTVGRPRDGPGAAGLLAG